MVDFLIFPENKVCFDDATFSFLLWVYAYALRVLTPQPPSLVLMLDRTRFRSLSLGPSPPMVICT